MVAAIPTALTSTLVFAADQSAPLIKRLDPQQRAGVTLALAAIVLAGLTAILLIWLGAHYVRRIARQRPPPRPKLPSDWDRKHPAEEDHPGSEPADND